MTSTQSKPVAPGLVDAQAQARLEARGYEVVELFSKDDVALLRDRYSDPVDLHPDPGHPTGFFATVYSSNTAYRRSVYELLKPLVNERSRHVLRGYDVRVASWLVKDPSLGDTTVPLHQDWSFVDERRHRSFNLWFPLVDVDESNGCLQVVPASHRVSLDHRPHNGDFRFNLIASQISLDYVTPIPMRAGQALIYDSALVHCSAHNRSGRLRAAVGTLLVPDHVETLHAYRVSPTTVEVFAVDDAFFWSHVPGDRPRDARLLGTQLCASAQHGPDVLSMLIRPSNGS